MKPKSTLRHFLILAGGSLLAISSASADQTWDGTGGDDFWNTPANWGLDGLPNFANAITFSGTTRTTNVNNLTAATTIGGINFTNSTAGQAFSISGNSITLGGNIVTTASSGAGITDILDLNLILNADRKINTGALHNLTISGISQTGTRKLTKEGAGTLTISGSTSFTGALDVTGGSLVLGGTNTMGAINVWFTGTSLTFGNGGLGASTALLSLGASSGSSTLTYTGSDDYSIGRQIQHGASGSGQGIIKNNGSGALIFTNSVFNTATGNTSSRTLSLGGTNGSSVNQIQGVISNQHGTHILAITKLEDASIWKFSGLNSYTGATTVNGGTLLIGRDAPLSANGALGNASSEVSLGVANGNIAASLLTDGAFTVARVIRLATNNTTDTGTRVLTLGGNSAHNSEFSGNIILGTSSNAGRGVTLTAASGGQVTFSGVIQNPTSMDATTYTVTKSGSGAVILSNTNTYTGATSVTAGTLLINGSTSSTSLVNVGVNGTLGGTGTVGGHTTISGTHNPGNSPGIQTFSGNLSYVDGGTPDPTVNWELANNTTTVGVNPTANFDQIIVGGNLDFTDLTTINLLFNGAGSNVLWSDVLWDSDQTWLLYDVAGTTTNFANLKLNTINWLDSGSNLFSTTGGSFSLGQSGQDVVLNYTAVPEPRAALLGGLGLLMLLRRRR
jgi:fibronectin-binding autotransporter adhesin